MIRKYCIKTIFKNLDKIKLFQVQKIKVVYLHLCAFMCVCVEILECEMNFLCELEEGDRSLEAGVPGVSEPPDFGDENQAQVLCKSSKGSYQMKEISSPLHVLIPSLSSQNITGSLWFHCLFFESASKNTTEEQWNAAYRSTRQLCIVFYRGAG